MNTPRGYIQPVALGLFDAQHRLAQIRDMGDPLAALDAVMDWSIFTPVLARIPRAEPKGPGGASGLCAAADVQNSRAPITLWLKG
jgi:hypothetical protein